jgi:hypothetical protein
MIELALQFEAELGEWYEATMGWHCRTGRLATRSGFRMFDIHRFYNDFVFPWWEKAKEQPEEAFVRTFQVLSKVPEASRSRKRDQESERAIPKSSR